MPPFEDDDDAAEQQARKKKKRQAPTASRRVCAEGLPGLFSSGRERGRHFGPQGVVQGG